MTDNAEVVPFGPALKLLIQRIQRSASDDVQEAILAEADHVLEGTGWQFDAAQQVFHRPAPESE